MAKDINLNSSAWCELIFEGKNQEYGAYYLRKTSSKRHLRSLLIVIVIGVLILVLPTLIKTVMPERTKEVEVGPVELSNLDLKQEVPEENQVKQLEDVPPPPILKETTKFTPPVIAKDEEVRDEDLMKTQEELTETKAAISIADVKGATDGSGVDIADLQEHKVVVQAEKEEIFTHVEVMPQFPGGDKELMNFLSKNIKYPVIAQEQGVQGTVTLRFVVDKEGNVGEIEVLRSLDPSCDKEAIRVVKMMPKWVPGKQNGRPVAVYYNLPVRYKLQQ
ncbi:MAG: TonB family protein [Dysgonamonadaceae bacterium]|jgi:protein TonB|nr:TonB family protein [Dysgonamonadaceae bacterium]